MISPLAKRNTVVHDVFDLTSVLRLIEWRWNLPLLWVRDGAATILAIALNFGEKPDFGAPTLHVPPFVSAGCAAASAVVPAAAAPAQTGSSRDEWDGLAELADDLGYEIQ